MSPRAALSRLIHWFAESRTLLFLWWALVAVQPLVSPDLLLGRGDLVPWAIAVLVLAVALRGRYVGDGPHPMLSPRRVRMAGLMRRAAACLVPLCLFAVYEAARTRSAPAAGIAVGLGVAALGLRSGGDNHGRTAWDPPGVPDAAVIAAFVGGMVGAAGIGGLLAAGPQTGGIRWVGPAILLGTSFFGAGATDGRVVYLRQRRAAGRKDGAPYRPELFRAILALVGPGAGLWLLLQLYERRFGPAGFEQAFAVALHVVVWVAVVFAPAEPAAVQCVLHEVVPAGGAEEQSEDAALSFEQVPEGALRLHPLRLRRTRGLHLWLVPVQGARIDALDDPVRPLWSRPPPPLASHVMGEARFEPDPISGTTQHQAITVRVRGQVDVSALGGGEVQTRRLAVLRPFPRNPWSLAREAATYRWERLLPHEAHQVLDATTQSLTLRDGDVVVLSTEGVARAFELEVGRTVPTDSDLLSWRLPQIEDYTEA